MKRSLDQTIDNFNAVIRSGHVVPISNAASNLASTLTELDRTIIERDPAVFVIHRALLAHRAFTQPLPFDLSRYIDEIPASFAEFCSRLDDGLDVWPEDTDAFAILRNNYYSTLSAFTGDPEHNEVFWHGLMDNHVEELRKNVLALL